MSSGVDVVVPCYNYARYLTECVRSALDQDGVNVRVLIIDDTSSDDTPAVGRSLAERDSRVTFRRHEVNQGHIQTYNEGLLGWARAEYSMLLSADDALTPGALLRATRLMSKHSDVGMTYGIGVIIGDDLHENAPPLDTSDDFRIVSSPDFLSRCCQFGNPVATPTAVVRTSVQQRLGGYRPDLPHSGDMEMWMRFATQGPVGALRAHQAYYRWHAANMSTRYYANLLSDQRERLRACTEVFRTWGGNFPQSGAWLAATSERLGEEAFWLAGRAFERGDLPESQECLRFAEEHYPGIRFTRPWWNFLIKRTLGPRLWKRIQPVVRSRRTTANTSSGPAEEAPRFHVGRTSGWWPGEHLPDASATERQ